MDAGSPMVVKRKEQDIQSLSLENNIFLMSRYKTYSPVLILMLALILALSVMHSNIHADDELEDHRVLLGLDGFPGLLAADLDITGKTDHGRLILVLVYTDRKQKAEELAVYLKEIKTIRKIPVQIELTDDTSLKEYKNTRLAGIFLTQKLGSELESLIQYGRKNHVIVYSPFEEDVKKGVPGGISITSIILPYVNMDAMKSSGIRIKQFFLRIVKQY